MSEFLTQIAPMAEEMIKTVLEALRRQTEPVTAEDWTTISRDLETMEQALVKANSWRAQDLQGAVFLRVSCLVLAAYRVLEPKYADKEELLDLLRRWLIEIYYREGTDAFLKESFKISNEHPETAWENLCHGYLDRVSAKYGQGWVYEQGLRDERRFFINVRKCLFADFFLAHDAREVLYQLCATDYVWGDALGEYNIRFERPTTLSEGSDACRFQFFNMNG